MDYSFFLFTQLYAEIFKPTESYDRLFDALVMLYSKYNVSEFNDPNTAEYECIVNFLNNLLAMATTKTLR